MMATNTAGATSALTDAISLLNTETDSLFVKFGQVSDKSKVWNIASRILSGSGLWKLQNRIRAVGNVINVFSEANQKALESQLKAAEAAGKYGNAIKKLNKEGQNITKSDYYKQLKKGFEDQGYGKESGAMAEGKIKKQYNDTRKALRAKVRGSIGRPGAGAFLSGGTLQSKDEQGKVSIQKGRGPGAFTANEFKRIMNKGKFMYIKQKEWRAKKKELGWSKSFNTWFMKKSIKIGRIIDIGLSFLLKFLLYISLATLLIMLLRKFWPMIKDAMEMLGGLKYEFETALSGVKDIFMGIWNILAGVFQGDFGRLWKGLKQVGKGLFKVLVASLSVMVKSLLAILIALPLKLARMIGKKIKDGLKGAMPKIPGIKLFASGGVSSGGLAIVGEQGPELVNLPSGARVHSNAASRRMGGNSIHVHVNGRVGASDAEIRDIANKVAREINLRMNRTGSASGAF